MSLRAAAPTSFVLYGPFPVYWLRVLSGTVVLLVAWGLFSLCFERASLTCERSSANVGRCVLTRGLPGFVRRMEIPLVRVVGVRVQHETTPTKGGSITHWGVPYLELHDATPIRLMRVSPDEARVFSSAIETGLHGRSRAFAATLRGPRWALFASIVPLALGLALLRSGLRGFGRIHFEIDDGAKTLTAKRLVLGVPVSTHIVSLDEVRDVEISWTYEKDQFSETGTERAGTLNLIDSADGERPVTSTSFRGFQVHLRAATALRKRLGAYPERGPLELELEEAEKPVPHPWGSTIPGKLRAVLLGAGWGSIVGVLILWGAYMLFWHVRGHESGGLGAIRAGALGAAGGVALALHLVRSRPPR